MEVLLYTIGGSETLNNDAFDRWSVGHAVLGFVLSKTGFNLTTTFAIAVIWEVIEPVLKDNYPNIFPHPSQDTQANKLGDIVSVIIGYFAGEATS